MSTLRRTNSHALVIRHENGYVHSHSNYYPFIVDALHHAGVDFEVDLYESDDSLSTRDVWQYRSDDPDQVLRFSSALAASGLGVAAYDAFYDIPGDGPNVKYQLVRYTDREHEPRVVWIIDYGWDNGTWFFGHPRDVALARTAACRLGIEGWSVDAAGRPGVIGSFAVDAKTDAEECMRNELMNGCGIATRSLVFRPVDYEDDDSEADDLSESGGGLAVQPGSRQESSVDPAEWQAEWEERCRWNPELRKIRWSVADAPRRLNRHPDAEAVENSVCAAGRAASKLIRQRLRGETLARLSAVKPSPGSVALRVLDIAEVLLRRLSDGDADGFGQLPVDTSLEALGLVLLGSDELADSEEAVAQFRGWLNGPTPAQVDLRSAVEVAVGVVRLLAIDDAERAKAVTAATRQANNEQLAIPRFDDPIPGPPKGEQQ